MCADTLAKNKKVWKEVFTLLSGHAPGHTPTMHIPQPV